MTADINMLQVRAQSLLEAVERETNTALANNKSISGIVEQFQKDALEIRGELNSLKGRVTNEQHMHVEQTLNQVNETLKNATHLSNDRKMSDFMDAVGKCVVAVASFVIGLFEQKKKLVFATQNQSALPGVAETGGPCTYCSLQYIEEALRGGPIDGARLDTITQQGATKYLEGGNPERINFHDAYDQCFKNSLIHDHEAQLRLSETISEENATNFGLTRSENLWSSAIDQLDGVEEGGAVITINGAFFHTYALVKKEGQYFFYDSHGEPALKVRGNPTYQFSCRTKEEFVEKIQEWRPQSSDFEGNHLVNIEGMDVTVVRHAART